MKPKSVWICIGIRMINCISKSKKTLAKKFLKNIYLQKISDFGPNVMSSYSKTCSKKAWSICHVKLIRDIFLPCNCAEYNVKQLFLSPYIIMKKIKTIEKSLVWRIFLTEFNNFHFFKNQIIFQSNSEFFLPCIKWWR